MVNFDLASPGPPTVVEVVDAIRLNLCCSQTFLDRRSFSLCADILCPDLISTDFDICTKVND